MSAPVFKEQICFKTVRGFGWWYEQVGCSTLHMGSTFLSKINMNISK